MFSSESVPGIPSKERRKLISRLQKYSRDSIPVGAASQERTPITVREAFPLGLNLKPTSESIMIAKNDVESVESDSPTSRVYSRISRASSEIDPYSAEAAESANQSSQQIKSRSPTDFSSDDSEAQSTQIDSPSLEHISLKMSGHSFFDPLERRNGSNDLLVICKFCLGDSDHDNYFLKCTGNLCSNCIECSLTVHTSCLDIVEGRPCAYAFREQHLRQAFFKVFTSILKNYRTYLAPDTSMDELFRKSEFIAQADKESRVYLDI